MTLWCMRGMSRSVALVEEGTDDTLVYDGEVEVVIVILRRGSSLSSPMD